MIMLITMVIIDNNTSYGIYVPGIFLSFIDVLRNIHYILYTLYFIHFYFTLIYVSYVYIYLCNSCNNFHKINILQMRKQA